MADLAAAPSQPGLPAVDRNFGAFAGQIWRDASLRAVSGAWTVPRITPHSNPGVAATWIAMQAPGNAGTAAFIQVGVEEQRVLDTFNDEEIDLYSAFWSDTARGFLTQDLFSVQPGDRITASLKLVDHRWAVRLADARGIATHFETAEEGHGDFNQAEWLQEDVTDSRLQRPFPYPQMSPLHVRAETVDGVEPPATDDLLTVWMNEHGGYLGPLDLGPGSFTLGPQTISAAGARYLRLITPLDDVLDWFAAASARWTPATSPITISAENSVMSRAFARVIAELSASTWPAGVQAAVAKLISDDQTTVADLQTLPPRTVTGIRHWISALETVVASAGSFDVRRGLGLPEYVTYNPS